MDWKSADVYLADEDARYDCQVAMDGGWLHIKESSGGVSAYPAHRVDRVDWLLTRDEQVALDQLR